MRTKEYMRRLTRETLNRFAATVSQGIKDDRACDALCEAVEMAGGLLAKYFPITPEDIDELPNEVMTEE